MGLRPAWLVTAVAVAVTGCGTSDEPQADPPGTIAVVASTNVWGSVVRAVGGDKVSVRSVIDDPSADPHSFEVPPADAAAVARARLVVYNGGGYDDFITPLTERMGPDSHAIEAFAVSGKPDGANEHVWYDLATVRKVADAVAADLAEIAPDDADLFAGNVKSFGTRLDELTTRTTAIGAAKPGGTVAATEPVAAYLIETAGLTDVTPAEFSEAVEEETDPPAAAVAEVTALITGKRVSALVNNVQAETPVTNGLIESARAGGVPVVAVTETLPEGVTGYVDWMSAQVDALADAMAGT
ncbi:MAG TPA: zinc ABC transporter substrate-binding protein [Actinophytocola sp.]|uniref:metal ABC transporter solute-binding protein, Zn/Mn family n=1 Tax=Actinophytocola sp. TaxID=1872138 RepID=UPI002DBB980F|nr:zinc ABC transporter substrate-binding protein [Actinophytocola sp.]HEU5471810.1 zinc ABC transporter substrate-binding protein [Actinophytocola sp.]